MADGVIFGRKVNKPTRKDWVDRRNAKRVVPMEVLVLGLPRTGTSSIVAALDMLGYPETYHMAACVQNPPDCDLWQEAIDAKFYGKRKPYEKEDWDRLLGHCNAVSDFPCATFSRELVDAYPDAKVVLNTRSFDGWYKSMSSTIFAYFNLTSLTIAAMLDPPFLGRWVPMCRDMLVGYFGSLTPTEESLKIRYEAHYREIRDYVPPHRLLEYRVEDGWETLCEFLGKDVPNQDFPRINETKTFGQVMDKMMMQSFVGFAKKVSIAIAPVIALGLGLYVARS